MTGIVQVHSRPPRQGFTRTLAVSTGPATGVVVRPGLTEPVRIGPPGSSRAALHLSASPGSGAALSMVAKPAVLPGSGSQPSPDLDGLTIDLPSSHLLGRPGPATTGRKLHRLPRGPRQNGLCTELRVQQVWAQGQHDRSSLRINTTRSARAPLLPGFRRLREALVGLVGPKMEHAGV